MKPIVAFDVDGVILDLHSPWVDWYNAVSGSGLTVEDIVEWEIYKFMPRANKAEILTFCQDPYTYDYLVEPYPGALEIINKVRHSGANVLFVSHTYPTVAQAKYDCLLRHGFLSGPNQFLAVPGEYKHLLNVDVLVEDNLETAQACQRGVLFLQPWNVFKSSGNLPYIVCWNDKALETILTVAQMI